MLITKRQMLRGASWAALILGCAVGNQALAQSAGGAAQSNSPAVEEVTVTGTSIRGAAPVGSNLVSVTSAIIETTNAQTVQQVLKSVPAVTGLGSAGQGQFGSFDNSGSNAPSIHDLGGSASNSTLILIDGHRLPLTGIQHTLADPNILPTVAIERVEVLADGASSIYGSDAIAGVINFITKKHYDGLEISGQAGFGSGYDTRNANVLWGRDWNGGDVLFAFSNSRRSSLSGNARPYTLANHVAQGGTNLASFSCAPASLQPSGSSNIYAYPYTGAGVNSGAANAPCDFSGVADLLPTEERNSVMAKVHQDFGEKLSFNMDIVFSDRVDKQALSRGAVTATVFGPGSGQGGQINPFFVSPANAPATSETVRFDANTLLGPGAFASSGARDLMFDPELVYHIDDNFTFTVAGTLGLDDSRYQTVGTLCTSCSYLGLNGTTNGAGNLTTVSIPGTNLIVLGTPLTAANSLDVFNTGSANRTSSTVLKQLTDSTATQIAHQSIQDWRAKLDGSLFNLPAGPVKAALGGEYTNYNVRQDVTQPNNTGPASTGSSIFNLYYQRSVMSGYTEVLVPVVSEGMNFPLMKSLSLDLSGRYDQYSDFGGTANPKFALDWVVVDGVKLRANYAESFVAPALTSAGNNGTGVTSQTGYYGYGGAGAASGAVNVPTSLFPQAALLPGCVGAAVCQIGNSTITGGDIEGGGVGLGPQTGVTSSIGADFTPDWLPGLRVGVTYWNNKLKGGITSPPAALFVNAPDLTSKLTIYPNGATPAQLASIFAGLPAQGILPPTVYFVTDERQINVLNLSISGIDANIDYSFDTDFGAWIVGASVSEKLKFNQQIGAGQVFSVLGSTGFNKTFPSVATQGRLNAGWVLDSVAANVYVNYVGGYRNYSGSTVAPISRNAGGYPIGGGDKVNSWTTVDAHISYTLPDSWTANITHGTEIYVDANNLFDRNPPFYNVGLGYDTVEANPIGRVVSVGIRAPL